MPWKLTRHVTEREYHIPAGETPDLQDPRERKRMVIRPRKVTLYETPGTGRVKWACIEGQQVRLDGGLAGSRLILVGHARDDSTPPDWLDTLVARQGLTWENRGTVR